MRKRKIKKILTLLLTGILLLMSMGGCGKDTETGRALFGKAFLQVPGRQLRNTI